jgi:hypothetical protein
MSAEVWFARAMVRERAVSDAREVPQAGGWNPESFAREQICGLVRDLFFSNAERPLRQIVFSAVDRETDVRSICRQIGEELALETAGNVAVAGDYPKKTLQDDRYCAEEIDCVSNDGKSFLQQSSIRMRANLWLLPGPREYAARATLLHSYLRKIRKEFEYSIVEGPPCGESNLATAMAQFTDGIILVLSAHRTRRIMARKVKDTIETARVRLLGTILSNRAFPIPERIYRRL